MFLRVAAPAERMWSFGKSRRAEPLRCFIPIQVSGSAPSSHKVDFMQKITPKSSFLLAS